MAEAPTLCLTVKLLNDTSVQLSGIPTTSTVRDLKTRVKDSTEIPEERQRLLYRGRVLEDDENLAAYRVEDGHVIHCVARWVSCTRGVGHLVEVTEWERERRRRLPSTGRT